MAVGPTAMIYDHWSAICSGNFSGLDDPQARVAGVLVTKLRPALEKESHTFFTEATMGVPGRYVTAVASENLSDVPSPTALMTNSGALFVKNARVHISLSTLSFGSLGK